MEHERFVNTLRIKFAKEQQDAFSEIKGALDKSDLEQAFLLTHTLKGSAGLICEPELVKIATAIEVKLQHGKMPDADEVSLLHEVFNSVLAGIEIPAKAESAQEIDKCRAADIFDRLQPILEKSSADCFLMIEELEELPHSQSLIEAVESCDFEVALEAMLVLKEKLGI